MKHGIILLFTLGVAVSAVDAQPWFTEVTTNAGINHLFTRPISGLSGGSAVEYYDMTGGAVAEDFNGDGWIDLYVLQCRTNANLLYMNQGNGTFANEAAARGVDYIWNSMGASAADFDNDGDIDMAITKMIGMTEILINNGVGNFTSSTLPTSEGDESQIRRYTSPSWGDLNKDGYLELVFGRWFGNSESLFLYTNNGAGLIETDFFDNDSDDYYVFTPSFVDIDHDGRTDLASCADYTNSHLYIGTVTGLLSDITIAAGVGTDQNGMGSVLGDYDNDGDLDWFITSIRDVNPPAEGKWGLTGNRLYRNDGHRQFTDVTSEVGVRDGYWGRGAAMGDLDHDGYLDIFHVNGMSAYLMTNLLNKFNNKPSLLFRNRGDGTFTNIAAEAGVADTGQGRGVVLFDYDNDGDLDIFIANNQVVTVVGTNMVTAFGPPRLYRNDSTNGHHWLKATLIGTPPLHRNGIGSRVYLQAGGMTQMRELNASSGYLAHGPNRIAHFGLGTNTAIKELRAEWISGDATMKYNVPVDQAVSLESPKAGISTNYFYGLGSVTASATNVAPLGTARRWIVHGITNNDPVTATFGTAGTHDMTLHVYDASGTNIVWTEIRRIHVETAEFTLINGIGPVWTIEWAARSGYVYRAESATNFTSTWTPLFLPQTNMVDDVVSQVVTSAVPAAVVRLLESPVP